jgi:hypothetical protein
MDKAGSSMAARMAMIAITTRSSMSVKASSKATEARLRRTVMVIPDNYFTSICSVHNGILLRN